MICGFIDFGFLISFLYSDADGKVKISDADRNTPEIHETVLQLMVSLNRFLLQSVLPLSPDFSLLADRLFLVVWILTFVHDILYAVSYMIVQDAGTEERVEAKRHRTMQNAYHFIDPSLETTAQDESDVSQSNPDHFVKPDEENPWYLEIVDFKLKAVLFALSDLLILFVDLSKWSCLCLSHVLDWSSCNIFTE